MYSICNITSFDTFSYYQIIIYMQSINPYPVYTRISIAFLLQMYTSSLSLPPQLLLRCNYDAPGPRGHLGKSNWRFIVVQSHLTVQCFEKMCKLSHNQEPFASRMWHRWVDFWFKTTVPYIHKFGWNLQLEWFNNPQVPGRLTMEWPVKNEVKTTIRFFKTSPKGPSYTTDKSSKDQKANSYQVKPALHQAWRPRKIPKLKKHYFRCTWDGS